MKKQVSISLTDSQRIYLKRLSDRNGNSISSTIRLLVDGKMKEDHDSRMVTISATKQH